MTVYGDSPSTFDTDASTYPTHPGTGATDSTASTDSTTQQVKDKVSGAADTAKDKASGLADTAKDKVSGAAHAQVDTRSTQAGKNLAGVADQARDVSGQLREQGNDTAARLVGAAAGYTDRLAHYLRDSDAQTIINDVERYARRQPWAVAIGGLVVGFAASRVVRASRSNLDSDAEHDYRGATNGDGYGGYGSARDTVSSRELDTQYGGYAPPSDPVDEPIYAGMPSTDPDPTLGETTRGNL